MRRAILILALVTAGCQNSPSARREPTYEELDSVLDMKSGEVSSRVTNDTRIAAAKLAGAQGRLDDGIHQFSEVLKSDPTNRDALFGMASLSTMKRDYPTAIQTWTRYVTATNGDPSAISNLARTHEMAGEFKEAEVQYLRAVNADPKNKTARVNYGLMLARRNRPDEAGEQLSMVLPPAAVHYNLGAVCEQQKNFGQARTHYSQALQLDPTLREASARLQAISSR
jgi:Flp pilus assembly protein TadD